MARPCLNYHIGQCLAPCTGKVTRQEYDDMIKQLTLFLEGKHETVIRQLKDKMKKASKAWISNWQPASVTRSSL